MPNRDEFPAIFLQLKAILQKYEKRFVVDSETATEYSLNTKKTNPKARPGFFGGAGINKITVSFYLHSVVQFPDLRASLSPELRAHLSGRCCFRFQKADPKLFKELTALTKKSAVRVNE